MEMVPFKVIKIKSFENAKKEKLKFPYFLEDRVMIVSSNYCQK